MAHSHEHPALKTDSIGPIYPWTITVVKQPGRPIGNCQPYHCVTGETGPRFAFNDMDRGFLWAHQAAEQWASDQLNGLNYVDSRAILADLGYSSFDPVNILTP